MSRHISGNRAPCKPGGISHERPARRPRPRRGVYLTVESPVLLGDGEASNWRRAKDVETDGSICYSAPMKRDEAISLLQAHEADLKRLGVQRLYLFGSTARGEAGDDSDVDLFFDHEKGKLGLFELMT